MASEAVRVLLVDDDEDDCVLTRELLVEGFGGQVVVDWAETYAEGLERLTTRPYAVALLDYHLGSGTGIELLRSATARGCRVPVILLTGQHDRTTDLDAMHAGAADYLVKGRVTADLLERAIRYARERHRLLEEISALSLTDELTGLHNRRAFFQKAEQRLRRQECDGALCLLMFADLDGLKQANDTLGHEAGDRLLVDAARVLCEAFCEAGLVARLAGDEFVVLVCDVADDDGQWALDRLQRQVEAHNAAAGWRSPQLSISAGALCFRPEPSARLAPLLAEADARMLQCKAARYATVASGRREGGR